ncbi:MAG: hypothetical protein HQ526_09610, partial [Actinobacteria bacterium]|nr:hypothetical protein [Actinomycetota bacterium]
EGDRVAIAHVGDSRAYLLRAGELKQVTKDHTFVQTLVDSGRITEEEAAVHPKRNLLMKALDGVHTVEPDLSIREVKPGDRFLLCSDGLSGVLTPADIHEVLSSGDPTGCVTALVERALEGGAPDNVTVVVADVVTDDNGPGEEQPYRMPVVVGAAAELRNRDQLPGIDFPEDSARDPDRADPDPVPIVSEESTSTPGRPKRRLTWLVGSLSVVAALLIGMVGFWFWANNQYYVGAVDGKVAIYQGIPDGLGPNGFSKAIQTSQTPVTELPVFSQEQVADTIPASDLDSARNILVELQTQATECTEKPRTPGCPSSPLPAPVPIPIPSPSASA